MFFPFKIYFCGGNKEIKNLLCIKSFDFKIKQSGREVNMFEKNIRRWNKKLLALSGELFFCFFLFFADFNHADSVGDDGEDAEPDGNVVVVINVINNPHHKGDDYYPFEPHNVFGVNIPGEHHGGNNRKPGYGVFGYCGNGKDDLKNYNADFKPNGAFPFCNDKVSDNADKGCDGTAVSPKKKMGKGVEPELKGLHDDIALFVFDKTD